MTQIKAHLMEKIVQLTVPSQVAGFSWLNKETLWPLRYLETFYPQITKNAKAHAENLQTINNIHSLSPRGKQFMVKEIKRNIGNKISKRKEFLGSRKLKFRSLFLKIRKYWHKKIISLIYLERVTSLVREMHLRVPIETQQVRKVDLNWTCLFLFTREWNGTFVNRPDFWFIFPYHPNFGPILDQFSGFFLIPL